MNFNDAKVMVKCPKCGKLYETSHSICKCGCNLTVLGVSVLVDKNEVIKDFSKIQEQPKSQETFHNTYSSDTFERPNDIPQSHQAKVEVHNKTNNNSNKTISKKNTLWESYILAFRNYFNFTGKCTRGDFWKFIACHFAIMIGFIVLYAIFYENSHLDEIAEFSIWAIIVYYFITLIPVLAITIRRYHDVGKKWYWMFIPIANYVLLLLPSEKTIIENTNEIIANPENLNKTIRNLAFVGYICVGINIFISLISETPIGILEAMIQLALILGFHLKKSKKCAVAWLVYCVISCTISLIAFYSITGWIPILISSYAINVLSKAEKNNS